MATALVTQIAYAVQTLFDPAGTAGRLVDLGKLANYGLLGGSAPTVWLPSELFTAGVNGTWYDPSDLNTLFQDAAGTQPVTAVEQPVGLMLDKSKVLVLGSELVTNGDFSNGTTGWTAGPNNTISVVSGQLKCVSSQADGAYFGQSFSVESGKTYKFVYQSVSDGTSQAPGAALGTSLGSENRSGVVADGGYAFGSRTFIYRATANETIWLWFYGGTGKPVGNYILIDNISVRELPGNHAFNSSGNSANFPVLSARYNLLTKTETFNDTGAWTKPASVTVNADAATAPNGTLTADQLVTVATQDNYIAQTVAGVNATGRTWSFSFYAKCDSGTKTVPVFIDDGNGVFAVNPATTTVNVTTSWQQFTVSGTQTSTSQTAVRAGIGGFGSWRAGDSIYIWGADLRVANDALNQPAYQRVNTATDYDTVGFKPYLRFNGTNQWLQTNSIDFTSTAQMFVSAGVRRNTANDGLITENSAASWQYAGAFGLGTIAAGGFFTGLSGSVLGGFGTFSKAAPTTDVLTAAYDIASSVRASESKLRVNGSDVVQTFAGNDAGTDNFGNYPLYIGARGGASMWFNGRLYQLVVAGKQASDAEITSTETYLNQKTGAF